MDELCELSAVELRRMIGAREISPVELLQSCRSRIEAVNPRLNAFVTFCWERAEEEARAAESAVLSGEALGPLHGLPIGIKETMVSGGVRTTFGSPIFADNVPEEDERLVAAVRKAGAITVGKTNVPEFGAGANTRNPVFGPTGNPFETRHGSAAARPAARQWHWPATWRRWPPAPTPAARSGRLQPIAASSASGRARVSCRCRGAASATRRSRCKDRWAGMSRIRH